MPSQTNPSHLPSRIPQSFSEHLREFGAELFSEIAHEKPYIFQKKFWSDLLMEWSMRQPTLKTNMFRLIDVLPSLRSSESIAVHVQEYLGGVLQSLPGVVGWGLAGTSSPVRAKALAFGVRMGVRQMARQFIAGATPTEALRELRRLRRDKLAFTVDLLGEYCVSEEEAMAYLTRYQHALKVFGERVPTWKEARPIRVDHPGERRAVCISVKLSALYSQCYPLNHKRSVDVLSERLKILVEQSRTSNAQLYIDAEDTGHNPIVYDVFERVFGDAQYRDIAYPGIVLQAYTRESELLLERLLNFARRRGTPIAIRLVKGAYWDAEMVQSSQNSWPSPVFHYKESSDANYEKLSMKLLDHTDLCLPAFGSHNIRSLSYACCYAEANSVSKDAFELQMLYGMAEPIARAFSKRGFLTRLYVPLGELIPGMGYLVRRLLENTSNESFLRHTFFDRNTIDSLLEEPNFHPADDLHSIEELV